MSLIFASTRAVTLLAGIGYDVVFQAMVKTGSSIVNTAYWITERPDYPKQVSKLIYELDLTAKIALVNNYIRLAQEKFPARSKMKVLGDKSTTTITEEKCVEEVVETLDMLDAMISGDQESIENMIQASYNQTGSTNRSGSTLVSLLYLQQSLVRIDTILLYIKRKFEEHQKKWFNWFGWRRLDVKSDLKQLELETKILEDRVKLISHLGTPLTPSSIREVN